MISGAESSTGLSRLGGIPFSLPGLGKPSSLLLEVGQERPGVLCPCPCPNSSLPPSPLPTQGPQDWFLEGQSLGWLLAESLFLGF